MRKHIVTALAAVCSLCAMAEVEEVMVLKLADGTTAAYPVENVESVSFETRRIARDFTIAEPGDLSRVFPTIPCLWRVNPAETGQATTFAFATAEGATEPADAPAGEYGLILSVSPSKLYAAAPVDLAAETGSYTLTLLRYVDGAVDSRCDKVVTGTLSTSLDRKNRHVTIALEAKLEDGTRVAVDYDGIPVDVDNVDAMIPAVIYSNEAFFYNSDGALSAHADVASLSVSSKSAMGGSTEFAFEFGPNQYVNGEGDGKITVANALLAGIDAAPAVINLADGLGVELRFGTMQISSIGEDNSAFKYKNIADNGTLTIGRDADGTYHIHLDVFNTYLSYMGAEPKQAGTNEHLILNFDGTPE